MTKTGWVLGALLGLGTGLAAWAGSPDGRRPDGPRERVSLHERLGLSGEQAEAWHKLRSEQQKASVQRRADMQKLHIELRDLLAAPTLDERAVRARARQWAELRSAAVSERVEGRLALRRLLTPEQVEKLRGLDLEREARRERWRRHRGRHAEQPGGDDDDAGLLDEAPER